MRRHLSQIIVNDFVDLFGEDLTISIECGVGVVRVVQMRQLYLCV